MEVFLSFFECFRRVPNLEKETLGKVRTLKAEKLHRHEMGMPTLSMFQRPARLFSCSQVYGSVTFHSFSPLSFAIAKIPKFTFLLFIFKALFLNINYNLIN